MSLYKREDIFYYRFTVDGHQYRGSTNQTTKQLATLVENDLMQQVREKGIEHLTRKIPTLSAFAIEFNIWLDSTHSLEDKTRSYYKNGWRLLAATPLADMKMDKIGNHETETTTFPGTAASANNALRTLRRMFTKAKEMKRVNDIPKFRLRKEWARSVAMSVADAHAIASRMQDGDAKDCLLILRTTGMRPKEVFSMRWEYLRLGEGYYQNPTGKTDSARRAVPLLGEAGPILARRHLAAGMPSEGWVFPTKSKKGHLRSIKTAFNRARDLAGLPKQMVLYTGRHGAMTDLAAVATTKQVMEIGGHTDPRIAMRYQHPDTKGIQARLDAVKVGRVQ